MNPQHRILLVEDDTSLGEILHLRLQKDYDVVWARSKAEALQAFATAMATANSAAFDLLILDVGLPDGTGFEIAQTLKGKSHASIVFLTAQGDAESRLQGYELGAEEYIPKPFHLKELLIRVRHVLENHKTQPQAANKILQLDELSVNFETLSITWKDGRIEYPPSTDMRVLQALVAASPKPISRDELMNSVWGVDKNPSIRTIDNTMVRLRQVLGKNGEKYIRSVRGVGYQWAGTASNDDDGKGDNNG